MMILFKQGVTAAASLAMLTPPAMAQDCTTAPFGPYGSSVPAYVLVSLPPEAGEMVLVKPATAATRGLVVARQEFRIAPKVGFLASDVALTDEKGKSLATAVPLTAGSAITSWRGSDGERRCSIGWRNGLFGGATGDGHYRWICFEDEDGDGAYEKAWRPRSKNMGLSYSRYEMPVSPAVRLTDTPPATAARQPAQTSVLGGADASRQVVVRSLSGSKLSFEYWGAGIRRGDENRVEVDARKGGTVTLAGIAITVTPGEKGPAISATGAFPAPAITPVCGGASYAIDSFDARVMFSFPNW